MKPYTHRELCEIAAKHLRRQGLIPFCRCQLAVVELDCAGEKPDAFGIGSGLTFLVECKTSRSDFLADRSKFWRQHPGKGLAEYRSYLCPEGLIQPEELPDNWGLLYVNSSGKVQRVKEPLKQDCDHRANMALALSILRREGIYNKILSYRNYKNKEKGGEKNGSRTTTNTGKDTTNCLRFSISSGSRSNYKR